MEVIEVMSRFAVIERASIDEAYMDLTAAVQQRLKNSTDKDIKACLLKTTYIQGYPQNGLETSSDDGVLTEDLVLDKGRLSYTGSMKYFFIGCRSLGLKSCTYQNCPSFGRFYRCTLSFCMLRGAEVQRCPAVAGILTCHFTGGAQLCRTAAHCGGADSRGNEGSRGKTHRFPVFSRDIT